MGELISDLFITLERWVNEHFAMPQVLLMGRVTYQALWAIAQNHPVEGPERMSELPKVVFSRTLRGPLAWDNSRVPRRT